MKRLLPVLLVAVGLLAAGWAVRSLRGNSQRQSPEAPGVQLAAACRQTGDWLRRQLGDECHVIVRTPFVIGGDLSEAELDRRHRRTIAPAARAMITCYFRTGPDEPITVLLFGGESAYRAYAKRLFGKRRPSSHGYYRPHLRTVIVNLAAGEKALLHELTHALMAFDFPDAPDWFNEGLAALHEQCRIDRGKIEGLAGRRLGVLQAAAGQDRLRTLDSLVGSDDFHSDCEELNYAHARYFCLYMQERGVLARFYRLLRAGHKSDPTGRKAVGRVFSDRSQAELDADFRRWVTGLPSSW